jgi:hypothetical protein
MRNRSYGLVCRWPDGRITLLDISRNRLIETANMFPLRPSNRYSGMARLPACAEYQNTNKSYG